MGGCPPLTLAEIGEIQGATTERVTQIERSARYSGACRREILEQDLREEGIIQKALTQSMLGEHSRVIIKGDLVTLAEYEHVDSGCASTIFRDGPRVGSSG